MSDCRNCLHVALLCRIISTNLTFGCALASGYGYDVVLALPKMLPVIVFMTSRNVREGICDVKARIFISSTYYDLRYLREQVIDFIKSDYHFEPVAFEKSDISYNPKQSMIKSSIEEINSCHAMILIIGNRYGSKTEQNLSVTRSEYREAVKCAKPIFVFVENYVHVEYEIYNKNGKQYNPAIADDIHVLEFIDEVKSTGVCVKDFKEGIEIIDFLRKQWAGFFSDFLINSPPMILQPTQIIEKTNIDSPEYHKFKAELEKRAKNNDAPAMLVLGYFHFIGNIYYERNFEKAFYWIHLASEEQGYLPAKTILGSLCYRGAGVKQDYEKAFKYRLEGAEAGDASAMEFLAFLYRHGIGCEQSIDNALTWYKKCTDIEENPVWINAMGETYEWKNDMENAAKAYKRASDKMAHASYNLASLYHRKLIKSNNCMLNAIKYYKTAADKGWTEASAVLGKLYFQGAMDGVEEQNFKTAEFYLSLAANAGITDSQYILAHMYEYGLGVDTNAELAMDYYRRAALQGHAEAQFALGQMLLDIEIHGNNMNENNEAFKWIKMSYSQGSFQAKRTMVDMYKYGIGCMKSNITSMEIIDDIVSTQYDEVMNTINSIYNSI